MRIVSFEFLQRSPPPSLSKFSVELRDLNLGKYSYLFKQTNICSSYWTANRTLFHEFAFSSYATFKKETVNILVSEKKVFSLFFIKPVEMPPVQIAQLFTFFTLTRLQLLLSRSQQSCQIAENLGFGHRLPEITP